MTEVVASSAKLSSGQFGDLISEVQSGFASGQRAPENGIVQLRMNNVTTDGVLDWSNYIRVPTSGSQLEKYQLRPGDILFNSTNSPELVGKTTIFDSFKEPVVFSNHFLRLRVKQKEADPWYLAWWLNSQWQKRTFENLATSWVNQASVRRDDLLALRISYPPLPEQQRIAAILAKADRLRRLRHYALDLGESYLQSVFLEMFGDPVTNPKKWIITNIESLGNVQGGLQVSSKRSSLPYQAPYLRVANVYRDRLDLTEIKLLKLTASELERIQLQKNDILIVEGHGNEEEIGRAAIWNGLVKGCVHQNHLIRVRINPDIASEVFICRYINSKAGRRYFTTSSNTTSGLNTISTGIVKDCPVVMPPLSLQQKFAQIVHKHERLRDQQREAARQAEHLFQTLLHRAFTGDL